LTFAEVPGPYVPVGHSAAGVFVQLYARTYPGEVVGVVAMNPVAPAGLWLERALPLMTDQERSDDEASNDRGEGEGEQFDWYTSFTQLDAAPALHREHVSRCCRGDPWSYSGSRSFAGFARACNRARITLRGRG